MANNQTDVHHKN